MIGIRQILLEAIRRVHAEKILGNLNLDENWNTNSVVQVGRIWERNVVRTGGPVIHLDMGVNGSILQTDPDVRGNASYSSYEYNFQVYLMYPWNHEESVMESPFRMEEIIPHLDMEQGVADILNRFIGEYALQYSKEITAPLALVIRRGVFSDVLESHQLTNDGWIGMILSGSIKVVGTGC